MSVILEDILAKQADIENGIPQGESLESFIHGFRKALVNFTKKVTANDAVAIVHTPEGFSKADKVMQKMAKAHLAETELPIIDEFTDFNSTVYKELFGMLKELGDLEERLYLPLNKFLASLITDPSTFEKVWFDRNVRFIDVAKQRKEFNKLIQDNKDSVKSEVSRFDDLYRSIKDVKVCEELLIDMKVFSESISLDNIKSEESRTIKLLASLEEFLEENPDVRLNKKSVAILDEVFEQMTIETEQLAFVLYKANVYVQAHNDAMNILMSK